MPSSPTPPIDPHRVPHRGMITVSTMLATVMQAIDTTIANVALPSMQGTLQASQDQITWVLTSYIVAAAIATPITGWLCGRWGRKTVFLASVVGFTIASALCGVSSTLWQIVLARLLQGVFGAALVPLSQGVLLDIYPPEKVGQGMAIWGAGIMVGPILGPMLGGWLTEAYDWRWVFFINLPVGVLAFYGIVRYLPETRPASQPLDRFGLVTLCLAVGLLQLFLDRGELLDWFSSIEIRVEVVGCVVALAFFVVHTATLRQHAFLNRALLRDRNFVAGVVLAVVVGMMLYGTMAVLPLMLQGLLGYPAVDAGMVVAPRGIGTMLAMIVAGRLMHRIDVRALMAMGFLFSAFALHKMTSLTLDMDSHVVIVSGLIQGVGIGFIFVPMSAVTFSSLSPHLRNDGTPFYGLMRNIGSSAGISIVQAVFTENAARAHASLSAAITADAPAVRALGGVLSADSPVGLSLVNAEVTRQAAMMAYLGDFQLMMWMTLACMPFLLLIRPPPRR